MRPLYDPSPRENAYEELQRIYNRGDIRAATYWETLIRLHQTELAVNMAFEQFDQKVLNPVMIWVRDADQGRQKFRSHPRFIELVEYVGLADYWDDVGWPISCEQRGDSHFCGNSFAVN